METKIISNLKASKPSLQHGNKARNLINLMKIRGINVPETWIIPWDIQQKFSRDQISIDVIEETLEEILDSNQKYAVRSSSNIEDGLTTTFAGLFTTVLNVEGFRGISRAITQVWDSIHSEAVQNYSKLNAINPEKIKMAVIIQEMVNPLVSGVLFSRNPMTGAHEIVIECVRGVGTALVQDGITPERWVSRSGGWVAKPEDNQIAEKIIHCVLDESQKIIKRVKTPVDLEWVYDGNDIYWVQMREITTLNDLDVYSNRLSKDMMPGMIHPLIWSINVPLINSVWLGLLEEIVGDLDLKPEDLAKSFYFRSYFNMGKIGQVFTKVGFPSEGLEMMMGIVPEKKGRSKFRPSFKMARFLPKLLAFLIDKWRFEKRILQDLPEIEEELAGFSFLPDQNASIDDHINDIHRLNRTLKKIVYLNVVTPLLVSMYARMLEQQLEKIGVDMIEFDLTENMPELDKYNLNVQLANLRHGYLSLSQEERRQYDDGNFPDLRGKVPINDFEEGLVKFLDQYGHFSSNSNNFMAMPWREKPSYIIDMIKNFDDKTKKANGRIRLSELSVKGLRRSVIKLLYYRARRYVLYREKISTKYVYGYGLFRPYVFTIAEWLLKNGIIKERDDIFFLSIDEIESAVINGTDKSLLEIINHRRNDMEEYEDFDLPEVIFGENPPPLFKKTYKRMNGTPTSPGYYAGCVKIIKNQDDFWKVENGDVIVIPYSDVGWAHLFSRAGGVISESGGILSHSSIIAREYQIPAVVSVPYAMQLKDNQRVSLNGFTGEIVILDNIETQVESIIGG